MSFETRQVYLNGALVNIASTLIGIFIPIYLLETGYSPREVTFWLLAQFALLAVFSPIANRLQPRLGIKRMILIAGFVSIATWLLFLALPANSWLFYLTFILTAFYVSFYWLPMNSFFGFKSDARTRGMQTALWAVSWNAPALVAPVIGAFLLSSFGYTVSFITGCAILLLSAGVMFLKPDFTLGHSPILPLFKKENLNFFLLYLAEGTLWGVYALWPLTIFLFYPQYAVVGLAIMLFQCAELVVNLAVGSIADRVPAVRILRLGAVAAAALAAVAAPMLPDVYVVSVLVAVFTTFIYIPEFVLTCRAARGREMAFMSFREISLMLGRALIFCVFIITLSPAALFLTAACVTCIVPFLKFRVKK